MNIFNFIRNKTKAFPTLISDFGREQGFLTLRNFIDDGRIFKYIDKNEPENIEKLITLEALLNARPRTGIVGVRYLKESGRLIFVVGECFDNTKTLTEILNLPCGPENYLERVKLRREYIDSRLKENPSEVFWDYPDYFGGRNDRNPEERHVLQILTNLKVNTNGVVISSFNNIIGLPRAGDCPERKRKNYIDIGNKVIDSTGVEKLRLIRRSRLVACTFVPMSPEIEKRFIKEPDINIVPDHLDMDKQNDNYLNFEWVMKESNTVRGLVGNDLIKYYLITIVKGNRLGEKFVVHGRIEGEKCGINKDTIKRGQEKPYAGVIVQIISEKEATNYQRGFNDPTYFDQFKNLNVVPTNKQVQYYYTPLIGPFKNTEFKVTGKKPRISI